MGDSSDSEEFYDAEEFTPIKGSKRSSLCKSSPDSVDGAVKDKTPTPKTTEAASAIAPTTSETEQTLDDKNIVKTVVQGRKQFQELRRCMQTEEDDEGVLPDPAGTVEPQSFSLEHPFKIISHDTMSLQSMTSLGRIGRILSGASESQPNIRDTVLMPSASSREPSTISDDPMPAETRSQNEVCSVLGSTEPDVIASTKANSLKHAPPALTSHTHHHHQQHQPQPQPPPRRKKLNKLHGSQSLSTADGDNLSVCTTDTDTDDRLSTRRHADTDADERMPTRRHNTDTDMDECRLTTRRHADTDHDECRLPTRRHNTDNDLDECRLSTRRHADTDADNRMPTRRHNTDNDLDECRLSSRRLNTESDMDDCRLSARRYTGEKPHLHSLIVEPPSASTPSQFAALPSPASTIESLTREFQDSLELSHSKYASDMDMSINIQDRIETRHRSVTDSHDTKHTFNVADSWAGRGSVSCDDGRRAHGGTASLGATGRRSTVGGGTRRRSLGDEGAAGLRTRTASGHTLSDTEILDQVTVLNLDTGERVPLSVAEHKLPQCINPLSLHIMRLTSEYIANHDDDNASTPSPEPKSLWRKHLTLSVYAAAFVANKRNHIHPRRESDEESESVCAVGAEGEAKEAKGEATDRHSGIKRKTDKLKRFFGSTVKRTVEAAKSLAAEVSSARHKEDVADIVDDVRGEQNIKLKASNSHKGPYDFDGCIRHVQEMGSGHCGAVWCCKFSVCGRLLATAGQDKQLRVWVARDAYHMFQDMRTKYNAEKKSSPTPSQESLASLPAAPPVPDAPPLGPSAPFCPKPFCVYSGHTSDLLDVSWSKNYFLLSSSMDKTVRLWHISRGECLCCFQHIDFVTAIVFHPRDDRYFLSGSLDGKLRLWDIPDKKVAVWNEVDGKTKLITAANFCQNGKFAVVGTYDGRCIFYTTDQLKYHTQIDVRSTRGKNSTGRKISGIEPMPNDDKILVTSNDSRIRLYDLRDLNLSCKYKGYVNVSSQIKASFSHDGKYIVSGSENQCIYIWKTYHDYSKFTSVRRDRNDFWEGIKAHNAVVTCTVFAPNPDHFIRAIAEREKEAKGATEEDKDESKTGEGLVSSSQTGHVLVSADFNGCIKVFVHRARPKHSSLPASALV